MTQLKKKELYERLFKAKGKGTALAEEENFVIYYMVFYILIVYNVVGYKLAPQLDI